MNKEQKALKLKEKKKRVQKAIDEICPGTVDVDWQYAGHEQLYSYYNRKTNRTTLPPKKRKCICGQHIERNYYVYNKELDKVLVIGSICKNAYLPIHLRNITCDKCGEPYQATKYNICRKCREVCNQCGEVYKGHKDKCKRCRDRDEEEARKRRYLKRLKHCVFTKGKKHNGKTFKDILKCDKSYAMWWLNNARKSKKYDEFAQWLEYKAIKK